MFIARPFASFAFLCVAVVWFQAGAATLTVTTATDEFDAPSGAELSLREAVRDAADGDAIEFAPALSGSAITLTRGEIQLPRDLVIDASTLANGVTISGADATRLFNVGASAAVILRGLDLIRGAGPEGGAVHLQASSVFTAEGCLFQANSGRAIYRFSAGEIHCHDCRFEDNPNGAIYASGTGERTITIADCTFEGNEAGFGAGVYVSSSTLTVERCVFADNKASGSGGALRPGVSTIATVSACTFVRNSAHDGGGIYNESTLLLGNSTFSGNFASGQGGGVYSRYPALTLRHVTIVGNTAVDDGGGLFSTSPTTLGNSLLADNRCVFGTGPDLIVSGAALTREGVNLIGTPGVVAADFPPGLPNANGDWVGSDEEPLDPHLAPLGDWGGPSPTRPPLPGSVAIDQATATIPTDQRGQARPQGAASDIGAVERLPGDPLRSPADQATGLSRRLSLRWPGVTGPAQYEVFFGSSPAELASVAVTDAFSLELPTLAPLSTYYWRVDTTADGSTVPGPVQSFTTRPDLQVDSRADLTDPSDGLTTLREAIATAAEQDGWDRIGFAPALSGSTCLVTGSSLGIARQDLQLDAGDLAEAVTVTSNDLPTVLEVNGGARASFDRISFTASASISNVILPGVFVSGGAEFTARDCLFFDHVKDGLWLTDAQVVLLDCHFEGNYRGLFVRGQSSGTVERCVFDGNRYGASADWVDIRFLDCTFVRHRSDEQASPPLALRISGGVVAERCLFEDNEGISLNWSNLSSQPGIGQVRGSIFRDNPGTAITNSYTTGRFSVAGCLFERNAEGAIRGACEVTNSVFRENAECAVSSNDALISNCLFVANRSNGNGGALNLGGGTAVNCTFVGNEAEMGGAVWADEDTVLKNLTVVGNRAFSSGGGIYLPYHALEISGCLVANNQAPSGSDLYRPWSNPEYPLIRNAANLIGNNDGISHFFPPSPSPGAPNENGDLVGTAEAPLDPLLSPLGPFGSPTECFLPLPGSPALDRIDPAAGPALDQRGVNRPQFAATDIGAAEFDPGRTGLFPADGVTALSTRTKLRWLADPGDGPFTVLLGPAGDQLVAVATVDAGQFEWDFAPGTTYYWQVETPAGSLGPVQSFSTRPDLVVTTEADTTANDGDLSLREAIALADGQVGFDRIIFSRSLQGTTVTLASPLEVSFQDLAIDTFGLDEPVTLSGDSLVRLLRLSSATNVTLRSLALSQGAAEEGGAILAEGGSHLELEDCAFTGNTATDSGGAIALKTGARLTADRSNFTGNAAGEGGAIALVETTGTVTLRACTFEGNTATYLGGAVRLESPLFGDGDLVPLTIEGCRFASNTAAEGGAVACDERSSLTILRSRFTGNSCTSGGGALHAEDRWTLDDWQTTIRVETCCFDANVAGGRAGAIHLENTNLELRNVTLSGNAADYAAALYLSGTSFDLRHITITDNSNPSNASGYAVESWGTLTLQNCIVGGNHTRHEIHTPGPEYTISLGGNVIGNHETMEEAFPLPVAPGAPNTNGDWVGSEEAPLDPLLEPLTDYGGETLVHLPLSGSPALNAAVGEALDQDQRGMPRPVDGASDAGGAELQGTDTNLFTPDGVAGLPVDVILYWRFEAGADDYELFLGAGADPLGSLGTSRVGRWPLSGLEYGTTYSWRVDALRDGTRTSSPTLSFTIRPPFVVDTASGVIDATDGLTSLPEAVIEAEQSLGFDRISFAPHLDGGTINLNSTLVIGFPGLNLDISNLPSGLTLRRSGPGLLFSVGGGFLPLAGLQLQGDGISSGSALSLGRDAVAQLTDCSLEGFRDSAIIVAGELQATSCLFRDNFTATSSGGGAIRANSNGEIGLDTCRFESNEATIGGAISLHGATVTCTNSLFEMNRAEEGGGLHLSSGTLTLQRCRLLRNRAEDGTGRGGGALYCIGSSTLLVEDTLFEANATEHFGGAMHLDEYRQVSIDRCAFLDNTAALDGGALVETYYRSMAVRNSTFTGNHAVRNGGAAQAAGTLFAHCTITGNSSGQSGGGLAAGAILENTVVAENSAPTANDIHQSADLREPCLIGDNTSLSDSRAEPGAPNNYGNYVGTASAPVSPGLAPLNAFANGLPSRPPLPGSPVIDAGDRPRFPPDPDLDQHGLPRPVGPEPDLGAVEARPFTSYPLLDDDADGIDDRLEPVYGLTPGVDDSSRDTDGDGQPDGVEIAAMTDPTDPSDFLRILTLTIIPGSDPDTPVRAAVRWNSFPGLSYEIATSADLAGFVPTGDPPVMADGLETETTITFPPGHRFLRVSLASDLP